MPSPRKPRGPVICTENPSTDHTYSITHVEADEDEYVPGSPGSSIDDEYDFGSDDDAEEFSDDEGSSSFKPSRPLKRTVDNLDSEGESGVDEVDGCVSNSDASGRTPVKRARIYDQAKRHRFEETSEEEKKKIAEGADALLNLAGICLARQRVCNFGAEKLDGTNEYPVDTDPESDVSTDTES